jgi:hypothetical protein
LPERLGSAARSQIPYIQWGGRCWGADRPPRQKWDSLRRPGSEEGERDLAGQDADYERGSCSIATFRNEPLKTATRDKLAPTSARANP